MIFLLNKIFYDFDYDIVFNTNLDDYYHPLRFAFQIKDLNEKKSLLNSTLWTYIEKDKKNLKTDIIYKYNNDNQLADNAFVYKDGDFRWTMVDSFDTKVNSFDTKVKLYNEEISYHKIKENLLKLNNVINHSGVCFTREFWLNKDKYKNKICYRDDKPYEDLSLWNRTVKSNIKISVVNRSLIFYRIHNSSIGSQLLEKTKNENENKNNIDIKFKTFEMDQILQKLGMLIY